jgi:uncharacterized protein (TIGR03067 family)
VEKNLPARPNLDHLRRQAKALISALESGDREACLTILKFLPAAEGMSAAQVQGTRFRLADAQSAIARKNGFGSWPQLARHVEQLRALEGSWAFVSLEVDGTAIPASGLEASRLLIDGDRFRTESPEANYDGVFNINVEADPHEIDIEFVEGPEAGNWNFGIYRFDGDRLQLCLDLNGKPRPTGFRTSHGSGHAFETLKRTSQTRPEEVTGGTPSVRPQCPAEECVGFEFAPCPTLTKLEGEWTAVQIVRDGQDLPQLMLPTGLRTATKNEVRISVGGRIMIHALMRLDESADPIRVDYYNLEGEGKGAIQLGIVKWIGDEACFCMAAPGKPRPDDFLSAAGSGRTLSQWRLKR